MLSHEAFVGITGKILDERIKKLGTSVDLSLKLSKLALSEKDSHEHRELKL